MLVILIIGIFWTMGIAFATKSVMKKQNNTSIEILRRIQPKGNFSHPEEVLKFAKEEQIQVNYSEFLK